MERNSVESGVYSEHKVQSQVSMISRLSIVAQAISGSEVQSRTGCSWPGPPTKGSTVAPTSEYLGVLYWEQYYRFGACTSCLSNWTLRVAVVLPAFSLYFFIHAEARRIP